MTQHFVRTWFKVFYPSGAGLEASVEGAWYSIIFLAADTILYVLLALYLDAVFPGNKISFSNQAYEGIIQNQRVLR